MLTAKKLIFTPVFLIFFAILIYQLSLILKSYDFVFSLSINTLIQLIILSALISLSSLTFVLFATFANNWKLILPIGILASLVPFAFWDMSLSVVFAVGILVSLLLAYLTLDNTLKSYLTFNPTALLGPSVRHLSGLLILSFCLVYFLSANQLIAQNGFQIPDSLIDTALKLTPIPPGTESTNQLQQASQPQLTQEQIDLLKQNPDLLKQSGLDPAILDTLAPQQDREPQKPSQNVLSDTLKQTIKDQLQGLIKPYQGFVPATLAVMLFLTLQSLTSILNLLIYPLLWLTFFILEKTGFVKFTQEMRPVKKIVV